MKLYKQRFLNACTDADIIGHRIRTSEEGGSFMQNARVPITETDVTFKAIKDFIAISEVIEIHEGFKFLTIKLTPDKTFNMFVPGAAVETKIKIPYAMIIHLKPYTKVGDLLKFYLQVQLYRYGNEKRSRVVCTNYDILTKNKQND